MLIPNMYPANEFVMIVGATGHTALSTAWLKNPYRNFSHDSIPPLFSNCFPRQWSRRRKADAVQSRSAEITPATAGEIINCTARNGEHTRTRGTG